MKLARQIKQEHDWIVTEETRILCEIVDKELGEIRDELSLLRKEGRELRKLLFKVMHKDCA